MKQLTEGNLEHLKDSMISLSLRFLIRIGKDDLIKIILLREAALRDQINDWNDSLKNNDRKIFNNMKKEIETLRELLLDNTPLINKLQEKIKKLEKKNLHFNITVHKQRGENTVLINKLKRLEVVN